MLIGENGVSFPTVLATATLAGSPEIGAALSLVTVAPMGVLTKDIEKSGGNATLKSAAQESLV